MSLDKSNVVPSLSPFPPLLAQSLHCTFQSHPPSFMYSYLDNHLARPSIPTILEARTIFFSLDASLYHMSLETITYLLIATTRTVPVAISSFAVKYHSCDLGTNFHQYLYLSLIRDCSYFCSSLQLLLPSLISPYWREHRQTN